MSAKYGRSAKSSAFQWFFHRITGTFLVFLLITHFWVQHYDRTTASISHDVVTAEQAAQGVLPRYSVEANAAVAAFKAREAGDPSQVEAVFPEQDYSAPADRVDSDSPGPTHPDADLAGATPYDILMLRLADPVYAVLWKGFNLLFLVFALHHGFYGLNNILTDYVRNDLARVGAVALSWTVAFGLFIIGAYSVIVAGL